MARTVLVCGGRDFGARGLNGWAEERFLNRVLDELHEKEPIGLLVHGGADGADTLAGEWAAARGVDLTVYYANWTGHAAGAGPRRNARMLAHARPDLVVAFRGGKGTADCVRQARAAGVRVMEVTC